MATADFRVAHHDWHSTKYVDEWIARDVTRDDERRPLLRKMLEAARFPTGAAPDVLDVGGGYGVVTEEVLKLYPNARPTLQDYSRPMLERARARMGDKAKYVLCDLFEPDWVKEVGGPFDLAVTAIALHNLGKRETIFGVYRAIKGLLKPGGAFLQYDRFPGGLEPHLAALREAGFTKVESIWEKSPIAIVIAK